MDIRRVDLFERAVPPPRVVAVVGRPGVGRLLQQLRRIQLLRGQSGARHENQKRFHFKVTRYAVTLWMSASVYLCRSSVCARSGSVISTFGDSPSRRNERYFPEESRSETLKSSTRSSVPVATSPD